MSQQSAEGRASRFVDLSTITAFKSQLIGGVIAGLIFLLGTISVGQISGVEARSLLQSMLPAARFLYSSIITASATILALMLTLLSLSFNTQSTLHANHYRRVKTIALIDTYAFVLSMALLVFLVVPMEEPQSLVPNWFGVFYYVTIAGSALLGGLLVAIVLMLYATVRDLIAIFGLGKTDHPLLEEEEDDD